MRANLSKFALLTLLLLAAVQIALAQTQTETPTDLTDTRIPRNSKVYIAPAHGSNNISPRHFGKRACPS